MSKALKPIRLDLDPNSSDAAKQWKHWKRTFDNFIEECGETAPDRFRSIVNFISAEVFDYVEDCTTYDAVIETLERLFVKTPNKIFARHDLATRKQQPGESLDEFLEELKKLSKHCGFTAVTSETYRSEMIRDSFINGLTSNYIRQRLLENSELSLDRAYDIARTLHTAQKNSELYIQQSPRQIPSNVVAASISDQSTLHTNPDQESLAAVRKQTPAKRSCYFCGGFLHANRASCPARDAVCHNCSKKGHFAKVCQSTKKAATVNAIYKPSLCTIIAACPSDLKHASISVKINDKVSMTALIDSCSSDNYISEDAFNKLQIPAQPSSRKVTMAQTSMESPIIGKCNVVIELKGKRYDVVRLDILPNLCSDIILGYEFQKRHKNLTFHYGGNKEDLVVTSSTPKVVSTVNTKQPLSQQITDANVAAVDPPTLFKSVSNDVKPVATKSRFFNKDDRAFIRDQISSLLAKGLIKRSDSPWRAQVMIARDELQRHKKRMCIDYSQTINLFTELDAYPLPRIEDMVNKLSQYKVFSTFDLKSAYHQIPHRESETKFTAFEALGDLYEFVVLPFGVTNGVPSFQRIIDNLVTEEGLKNTFPYLDNVTVAGVNQADHDKNVAAFLEMIKRRNITLNESKSVYSVPIIDILGYRLSHQSIKPDPERLQPLQDYPPPSNVPSLRRALGMFAYYAKWISQFSDKIRPLADTTSFPLDKEALASFNALKDELARVALSPIDEDIPFIVECDASDVAISASLNQNGRPVAFMSKTLSATERRYPAVEKEALAIIEAVRKWNHLLSRQPFILITDQKSVSFMFDNRKRSKIKNSKIQSWRLELAEFSYTIQYREGKDNVVPDSFTRAHCAAVSTSLEEIHSQLCHPGVIRLLHFVKAKNLPFSTQDVRDICSNCRICAELKPKFYQSQNSKLVKATRPMERLSIDFKGPLPSSSRNKFFLTVVDEYSRFPFAIPCPNVASETDIKCLEVIFSLCGMPEFIHSDRGSSFMSEELISFLRSRGIASSRSTPYHPIGNSQVERYNGIVWKPVRLALASVKLPVEQWERVLPDALHSIRSLLSTATNTTPHDRFFNFSRKSSQGVSLPSWLSPGPVLLRKFVRSSKNDDLVEEVELTHANPTYAHIRYKDGRESTVSLTDLAPCPRDTLNAEDATVRNHEDNVAEAGQSDTDNISTPIIENDDDNIAESVQEPRRSTRLRKKPERYGIQVDE